MIRMLIIGYRYGLRSERSPAYDLSIGGAPQGGAQRLERGRFTVSLTAVGEALWQ